MKKLFLIVGIIFIVTGILWLFFPSMMLGAWGVSAPASITAYMSSRAGAQLLGIAVIFSVASRSDRHAMRRAIFAGGATTFGILTVLSIRGTLSGVVGPVVWSVAGVEFIVTAAFLYYLISGPSTEAQAA